METNLIELARSYLTPAVVEKASPLVGESPATTQRALDAAIPALVGAVSGEASSIPGAARLLDILHEAGLEGTMTSVTERLSPASGEELIALGKDLLRRVLGPRAGAVVEATARSSGVTTSTMEAVMGLATPVVLGVLGSHVHTHALDPEGVAALLAAPKGAIATAETAKPPARVAPPTAAMRGAAEGRRHAWPILMLLALLALGLLFLRKSRAPLVTREAVPERAAPEVPAEVQKPSQPPLPAAAPSPVEARKPAEPSKRVEPRKPATPAPPGGATPRTEGTVGADVAQYLVGSGGEPSRRFVFEDLSFEFGTTNLTPSSLPTLDALAAALQAHPGAHVLLEGHTDAVGLPAANEQLSLRRAEAIKNALVARGVAADRIATRGLGQDEPVAPNDTSEGRAHNRRIDIVVTR